MKKVSNFIAKFPNKVFFVFISILFIIYTSFSFYLIYNIIRLTGIETLIRYAVIIILILLWLIFLLSGINSLIINKFKKYMLFILLVIIFGSIQFISGYYIDKVYSSVNKMHKSEIKYSTSLIAMNNNKISKISDLKNKKIGIISDKNDVEGYIISQDIINENNISKNELVEYDDFISMLSDLYDKKIDAIFISSNYPSMFSSIDHFDNIKSETIVVTTKSKTMAKQENTTNTSNNSRITKPFTMLLMGVDSDLNNINSGSFNGDSIILITFNPNTLNATILSIPRDTYVPIMCFSNHAKSKITHAAWQGESCMIRTVSNLTGIKIDDYVKINFKGVVNLVDALGGIYVDVPYSLCEQNSNREWGKKTIYVEKGYRKLNGEQALALSRNRHPNPVCGSKWTNYTSNDFVRGQNQQLVISSILNKLKDVKDINQMYRVLDLIEKNMDTNLTTSQILSFYNVGKRILLNSKEQENILNFQKLYLSTYGMGIYQASVKGLSSTQFYYRGSLNDIVKAMKINLGTLKDTPIKEFSFSIKEPYEPKIIGKGYYNEAKVGLVPDFTRNSKQWAINWGIDNNIPIHFITVNMNDSKYIQDQIINQSIHSSTLVENVSQSTGITLTVVNKSDSDTIDCDLDENIDLPECQLSDSD